jgi:hypothetical protein
MPATTGTTALSLALTRAASRIPSGPHVPGKMALAAIVIGLVVLWYVVYRVSLYFHPFTMCRRCGGSGKITGFLGWTRAVCGKCNGSGLRPRFGTQITDFKGRRAGAR